MKTHIPSAHAILTHPTLAEGLGALFSSEPSTVNIAAAVNVKVDEDKIDRIELFYEDSPEATIRATVNRLLSDRDEGMGLVLIQKMRSPPRMGQRLSVCLHVLR